MKWREWKGKSWLTIITHLCIKPYWLACKSGRLWLSVLEWIFLGGIYNRYQFFISFPRYCSPRYYSQKLIGKVVAKTVSLSSIKKNLRVAAMRSLLSEKYVENTHLLWVIQILHNFQPYLQTKIIQQFDKGDAFILIFPTIEINKRKPQKSKFTDSNDFVLKYTYKFTFLSKW